MSKNTLEELIDSIEFLTLVPAGGELVFQQIHKKANELFTLLPKNITSVKTERGMILHRDEYLDSIPTLSSLKGLILPTEQTKELKE
ncbi:MAG: hypothetical protein US29_C0054G0001 [candidate division WS6 bacterium GW2011_GWF1_36_8]|uniref:Uncharacterized protein n=2 Tax=Candidatus Dojkabacteria TaxID=74243 RepID=A0A0G0F720_9BACT|nr:MAG: hypothetical protein US29_C0054G0001 [candidate division WS6 bacterium GW2011_GWF1_36_8]